MTNPTETKNETMESKVAENPVDPTELVSRGKRNLLCREVPKAVNDLQEACSVLAEKYGEMGLECGEAYYLYGTSLLELSRLESGVLGNALDGVPEEDETTENPDNKLNIEESAAMTEEEKEKISDQILDAMIEKEDEKKDEEKADEKKENGEKMDEDKQTGVDEQDGGMSTDEVKDREKKVEEMIEKEVDKKKEVEVKKDDSESEKKETDTSDKPADENTAETKTEDKEEKMEEDGEEGTEEEEVEEEETSQDEGDKEKEEDVSNLQLAWEMLDLARVVYSKQETKEAKLKVADCHLKLGEVSLETDKYEEAINDISECLKIQKDLLDADDRRLAETNYQLGLAYNLHKKYDDAVAAFKTAVTVLEDRIGKLAKIVEGESEQKEKDEAKQEMEELKEIMPDVKSKIEDSEDEKKLASKKQEEEGETSVGFGASSSGASTSTAATPIPVKTAAASSDDKPVSDISHLMRKKRKPEDDATEEEQEVKKAKSEVGSGDADQNGEAEADKNGKHEAGQNGHAEGDQNGKNGDDKNGKSEADQNGKHEKEEQVIKTKTVEEVKAQTAEDVPMEEAKPKEEVKA